MSISAALEEREKGLGHAYDAPEIDCEQPFEIRTGNLLEGAAERDARIVHEKVRALVLSDNLVWKFSNGCGVGDVQTMLAHAHALRGNLLCRFGHSGFVYIGQGGMAAAARKRHSDSLTDAAPRTCYNSGTSFQL
jgi:hypothetical protein